MKKVFLGIFLMLTLGLQGFAKPITVATARQVAVNFYNNNSGKEAISPTDLELLQYQWLPTMYVFVLKEDAFVIVSADDCMEPIVGYSFDSPFSGDVNAELKYWLKGLNDEVLAAIEDGYQQVGSIGEWWRRLLYDTVPDSVAHHFVVPALCTTRWDQNSPYNNLCPYDSSASARTVVGCVATAMSQIMRYWNHPSCGTESGSYSRNGGWRSPYGELTADFENTTYIWDKMPTILSMFSSTREALPAATLCYHAGVSVKMMYNVAARGGSGAYSSDVVDALIDNFRYDSSLFFAYRSQYDSADWVAMIDSNLLKGQPLYYSGRDSSSGHAFVLDGCDSNFRYHFNWGWGGYGDGFYPINRLTPGYHGTGGNPTNSFNLSQAAIFGIKPIPQTFDTVDRTITYCNNIRYYDFYDNSIRAKDGTYTVMHLDTVVNLTLVGIQSQRIFLVSNDGRNNSTTISYCPVDGVVLPECTFSNPGYKFVAWGEHIEGDGERYQPGDTMWIQYNKAFYALWERDLAIEVVDSDMDISVYPNPTTGNITITLYEDKVSDITLFDAMGREVRCMGNARGSVKMDISDLPQGYYSMQITLDNNSIVRKIVKM